MQFFTLTKELYERLSPSILALLERHDGNIVEAAYPYGLNEIMRTTYLTTAEQVELTEQNQEISNLLTKYSNGQDIAVLTALLFLPMYKIEQLVGKARRHKKEEEQRQRAEAEEAERQKAEEEHKHQEEERKCQEEERRKAEEAAKAEEEDRQWEAAFFHVYPLQLSKDADQYLTDEEGKEFLKAAGKATEAYLKEADSYLDSVQTFDYRWWRREINDRKEKERQKIAANFAAQEYNRELNEEKARLKALLLPKEKDTWSYLQNHIKARCYRGQPFSKILSSEEIEAFDRTINNIGKRKLGEIVSSDFHQFIDGVNYRSYYFLPVAEYSYKGLPCIDFGFEVLAVVEVRVWLKLGQKSFGGYAFNLPWREEKGYTIILQEPELLGYHYLVLTPEDLGGYTFWQSIPLILLTGLLNGEIKPNGVTISAASDDSITYKVPKFKEEVDIPDKFAGYLKNIGSIDAMLSVGIITDKVEGVIKGELGGLKVGGKASLSEEKLKRKDSKKGKALELFSEGKRPSDPEVKSLGIKPESAYRYYQQWKKAH